jgi:hypothetical protein
MNIDHIGYLDPVIVFVAAFVGIVLLAAIITAR